MSLYHCRTILYNRTSAKLFHTGIQWLMVTAGT